MTGAKQSYVNGLRRAEAKGFNAGCNADASAADCPYKRYDYQKCWQDGFKKARVPSYEQVG